MEDDDDDDDVQCFTVWIVKRGNTRQCFKSGYYCSWTRLVQVVCGCVGVSA
jgi:hypothetical protein